MTSYRDHSDEDLAALYAEAGDTAAAEILAEMARRDERDAKHQRDIARWAAVREAWELTAHAQYLAAEAECRGNLVRREYLGEITDGWELWSGSHRWAWERATDELRDFWKANRRFTVSEFQAQQRAANREERARAGRQGAR